MKTGGYFVIGAIKGGNSYKKTLKYLAKSNDLASPNVLYIGAAALNKLDYKVRFEKGFMRLFTSGHVSSLNLSEETPYYSGHGHPDKIEKAFSQADIVYFDGGGVAPLRSVFDRFGLKDLCSAAVNHGTLVGGLCGGGSFMAEQVVHYDKYAGAFLREEGAGLIKESAITCHIDHHGQFNARFEGLKDAARDGMNRAIALGTNQAVIFDEKGECSITPSSQSKSTWPFYVRASGERTALTCCSL